MQIGILDIPGIVCKSRTYQDVSSSDRRNLGMEDLEIYLSWRHSYGAGRPWFLLGSVAAAVAEVNPILDVTGT